MTFKKPTGQCFSIQKQQREAERQPTQQLGALAALGENQL